MNLIHEDCGGHMQLVAAHKSVCSKCGLTVDTSPKPESEKTNHQIFEEAFEKMRKLSGELWVWSECDKAGANAVASHARKEALREVEEKISVKSLHSPSATISGLRLFITSELAKGTV